MVFCQLLIGFLLSAVAISTYASEVPVPEEYGSTGGNSLAFGGSVASGMGGASSIRSNPALLALEKEYAVNASYHWPAAGRDFYQVGVVDGKTSSVAAGFSYTGTLDNYQGIASKNSAEAESTGGGSAASAMSKDSPIVRRAAVAFAMPIGKVYLGAGGGYVEARNPAQTLTEEGAPKVKGFTLGFGLAAHLSESFRVGLSAENLANRKVQFAAPTYYRAAATIFFGSAASINLDYRRREAITVYEGHKPSFLFAEEQNSQSKTVHAENFANASTSIKVYDLLRFVAAAGQVNSQEHSATQISGGLALVNEKFNFSYQALKPNIAADAVHHALALGIDIAM
jgi:hypothetical protein